MLHIAFPSSPLAPAKDRDIEHSLFSDNCNNLQCTSNTSTPSPRQAFVGSPIPPREHTYVVKGNPERHFLSLCASPIQFNANQVFVVLGSQRSVGFNENSFNKTMHFSPTYNCNDSEHVHTHLVILRCVFFEKMTFISLFCHPVQLHVTSGLSFTVNKDLQKILFLHIYMDGSIDLMSACIYIVFLLLLWHGYMFYLFII